MEGAIGDNKVAVLCRAIFDEVVPEFSEVEISELGFDYVRNGMINDVIEELNKTRGRRRIVYLEQTIEEDDK